MYSYDRRAAVDVNPGISPDNLTRPQRAIYDRLSPAARRLFNDLATVPKYRGQLSTEKAKIELRKVGWITIEWGPGGNPKLDVLPWTSRGQSAARRLAK